MWLFALTVFVAGCAETGPPSTAEGGAADVQARLDRAEIARSVKSAMDTSADPCDDFYRYACGSWLDSTEIPADQSRWGRGFSVVFERNRETLRGILEQVGADPGDDPERAKVGDFYAACMDEVAVERAGASPLGSYLDEIARVRDKESFMAMTGKLHRDAVEAVLSVQVYPDFEDPDLNIAHFGQGGLGLPDRDYYLKTDEESRDLLEAYESHVARMLGLLGESGADAARHARSVVEFETELAEVSWPLVDLRDPEKTYHRLDITGLRDLTPEISWDRYLEATGYPDVQAINVAVPPFFEGLQEIVKRTEPETLQAYLRWRLASGTANLLSKEFVNENFEFFGKRLQGQKEIQARWKRCVSATGAALGEAVGRLYVEQQFAGESKQIALEMIQNIEAAFQDNLDGLGWMDDETRGRAVEKMQAIVNKIGYPDKWRDYSSLRIERGSHFQNSMAAREFEFRRDQDKVGNPVDRSEWFISPQVVNAFYNPLLNEMVFPAGILQRPFFHRDFPAAMNYGAMGMGMGHELTHGFDDQGRKFDGKGRMTQWWEPAVVERFEEAASCVTELYAGFEVQPDLYLDGELTLGENIADLGGIKESYYGYKRWVREHGEPESPVEGLTDDQLFFVGYAQIWCTLSSPEMERMLVTVDPHSPPRFRVNGPLSNSPAFAEAFGCEKGTPMHPEDTCEVW